MLKQNKFISIVAIIGTALAIMMIMAILVSEEVKTISVAPEINRDRTFYIHYQTERDTSGLNHTSNSGYLTYNVVRHYLSNLKTPEQVSAISSEICLTNREGMSEYVNTVVRQIDASYWKILAFTFIEGRPFSQEEFESGLQVAVINQSTAQQLFKGEQAIGQTILIEFKPYRVVGIVRDVSSVFTMAHGDIWIAYTSQQNNESRNASIFNLMLLARNTDDYPAISEEIRKMEKKYQTDNTAKTLELMGPISHRTYRMNIRGGTAESIAKEVQIQNRKLLFILLVLLLIPAINLSGFSLSRIKRRTAEIGVRKAFGAKQYVILFQVLCENLVTSLIGGVIGLPLSYVVVFMMRDWLLNLPDDSVIPVSTLVSLPVLLAVFTICLLINLLSAGIPAYRASCMKIVDSINQNDKQA